MPAGEQLRVLAVLVQHADRFLERLGGLVVEGRGDHAEPPSWIACQTRIGVIGMSSSVTPSGLIASSTAAATAGVAAIVPASPMPFTPSEFTGEGVSVRSVSMAGISAAVGSA